MLFVDVEKKLENAIAREIQPGEQVIDAAFGAHAFSEKTERKFYLYGLFIGGFLQAALSNNAFLVLTNQRILLFTLTQKYFYVSHVTELSLDSVRDVDMKETALNYVLTANISNQTYRFKFMKYVANLKDNGDRALKLANGLLQLTHQQRAVDGILALVKKNSQKPRRPIVFPILLGLVLTIPMVFLWMIFTSMLTTEMMGDPELQNGWQLATSLFTVFVFPLYPAFRFARFVFNRFQPKPEVNSQTEFALGR